MIQKFLKYYRFVVLVSFLVVKYRVLIWVLSDRALIRTLEKRFEVLKNRKSSGSAALPPQLITRRVNAVLRRLYPRTRCLLQSVVLNETLMLYGYTDQKVKFGVKYEDDKLLAHAWIGSGGDFKKVHEL
ncbi:MAG: lasso peptide biosynthesis B2 protein [Bacteroidales bacterium]|nr:lasso peptide biosynthesis B2 protein [Bacteroidales bacterium]